MRELVRAGLLVAGWVAVVWGVVAMMWAVVTVLEVMREVAR